MAGQEGGGAGAAGAGAAGAGTGAGGAPVVPGGVSAPSKDAGGGGAGGTSPRMITEDVLPVELRGRTPQEQKFILDNLASGLRAANARVKELEQKVSPAPKGDKPEPPVKASGKDKPLEERILEDAEGTIDEIVQSRYGGRIAQMDAQIAKAALRAMKQEHDDWGEVEEEVLEVVRQSNAAPTEENLELAYDVVIGRKAREAKRLARGAALNTEPVVDPNAGRSGGGSSTLVAPEGLEGEIFRSSGMTLEEWYAYKGGKFEVKVPTGKPASAGGAK